jgi:hypothetical protein
MSINSPPPKRSHSVQEELNRSPLSTVQEELKEEQPPLPNTPHPEEVKRELDRKNLDAKQREERDAKAKDKARRDRELQEDKKNKDVLEARPKPQQMLPEPKELAPSLSKEQEQRMYFEEFQVQIANLEADTFTPVPRAVQKAPPPTINQEEDPNELDRAIQRLREKRDAERGQRRQPPIVVPKHPPPSLTQEDEDQALAERVSRSISNETRKLHERLNAQRQPTTPVTAKGPPPVAPSERICKTPYNEGADMRKVLDNQEEELRRNQLSFKTPKEIEQERQLQELKEANRIKPKDAPPLPPTGGAQSPERIQRDQRSIDDLVEELSQLEDQLERRAKIESKAVNKEGQKLLGYNQGFQWCPKCQFVSNVGSTSELRHGVGLKGCQRRACEGCFQWSWSNQSPYEDEDFIFEGVKVIRQCKAYIDGIEGCKEGNKCLDEHPKWNDDQGANKDRCYVCGARKTLIDGRPNKRADHFSSTYCEAPGGKAELFKIADRVEAALFSKMPKRPNGQDPVMPKERNDRDRSRSKSRTTNDTISSHSNGV